MTLVAIYGPNEDNPEFFKRLLFNLNQGPCSRKYPKQHFTLFDSPLQLTDPMTTAEIH
jgi:hypothetical protein